MRVIWPLLSYILLSLTIATAVGAKDGIPAAWTAAAVSLLALCAGAGLRGSLAMGDGTQRIGDTLIAIALLGFGLWAGLWFSIPLFHHRVPGAVWGLAGFAVSFVIAGQWPTAHHEAAAPRLGAPAARQSPAEP